MPSVIFDRAAQYYDATRGFADGVAERICDAIVAYTHATMQTQFLELGVGTGRVALPFVRAGYDYTGVDLSQSMMDQLARKLADEPDTSRHRYRLVQADVTALPFADASFDVAIAVHVLHLVDGWQQALREAVRVLRKPGAWLLIAYDMSASEEHASVQKIVNARWDSILRELGTSREALLPGLRDGDRTQMEAAVQPFLRELGARTETVTLVEHATPPLSPRSMAQRHRDRMYSADWLLPDDLHAEAIRRLDVWIDSDCPNPDQPISTSAYFKAVTAHW